MHLRVVAAAKEMDPIMAAVPIKARCTRAPPINATGNMVRPCTTTVTKSEEIYKPSSLYIVKAKPLIKNPRWHTRAGTYDEAVKR
jgi:hypothetical protein